MQTIKAIYSEGVFRPVDPVELPEGSWVEVSFIEHTETQSRANGVATLPLVGEELAALLKRIDALALESETKPDLSTNYRLYC